MEGSGKDPVNRGAPAGQGVQVGHDNKQVNYFIGQYVDQRGTAAAVAGRARPAASPELPALMLSAAELRACL